MANGVLDLPSKALKGLLVLSGLAVGSYVLYRIYKQVKNKEASSPQQATISVAVAPLKKPKQPKAPKKKKTA